jgi:hypothetical protein
MKNYSRIVNYKVWEIVDDNVQNIVGKQIRNIATNHIDNIVKNNVERTIWIKVLTKIINNRQKSFKHNSIQQYKDNL